MFRLFSPFFSTITNSVPSKTHTSQRVSPKTQNLMPPSTLIGKKRFAPEFYMPEHNDPSLLPSDATITFTKSYS